MKVRPRRDGDREARSLDDIAAEALSLLGTGQQTAPFSSRAADFGLDEAYRITASIRLERESRGERPLGRKIGFTNRTIWAEYNVHAPIWGYIYDSTVHDLASAGAAFPLLGLAEPRIEPEIIFGLGAAPRAGMDEAALLGCVEWVAHGFEIVQSIFPGWTFLAADTVAAYGLHGALLIGPRHNLGQGREGWLDALAAFDITLLRDGVPMDRGRAANVLGGPLSALRHLVELLDRDPINPLLAAGEIITTGTLTRAFPVKAGESWTTALSGVPLEGVRLQLT